MKALARDKDEAGDIAAGRLSVLAITWPTTHRGPLVICATDGPTLHEPFPAEAVAVVDLVDCLPVGRGYACTWQLTNVRKVKPQRVKGGRLLFDVELEETAGGPPARPAVAAVQPFAGLPDVSPPRAGKGAARTPPAKKAAKVEEMQPGLF